MMRVNAALSMIGFEVVEAEFFLELLVRLLADPPRLDGARQAPDRRVGGQVRKIVLSLAGRKVLPNQPDFLAGQMLVAHLADALGRTIGDANA